MTVPDPVLHSIPEADPLPAVMLTVADHHERLALLAAELDTIASRVSAAEELLAASQLGEETTEGAGYEPVPAPRWWMLPADGRAEAADRLAAWTGQVYRPSYGHLAAMLPGCWPRHDLCLFVLDFLAELHSVLYLAPTRTPRTLADQAEFHLRILPAAAQLMAAETSRCDHPRQAAS